MIGRHALILSTDLPEESGTGPGRRVHQLVRLIKQQGFAASLLLCPLTESSLRHIASGQPVAPPGFSYFSIIPLDQDSMPQEDAAEPVIDASWNKTAAHHLAWLLRHRSFDLVFVTDMALTGAFNLVAKPALRVLDARAGFGILQHALATARGVSADAVHIGPTQEAMAYARAHAVLAGSSAQAAALAERHPGRTICLPYWDNTAKPAPPAVERRFNCARPLRLAFSEPVTPEQSAERRAFLDDLSRCMILYDPPVELAAAGSPDLFVVPADPSAADDIDMTEAILHGTPVLAQHSGLAEQIVNLAFNERPFHELDYAATRWAAVRHAEHQSGLQDLALLLRDSSRRILVIVDGPFWLRNHFLAESLSQALEFLTLIGRVVLCCVTESQPAASALPPLDCLHEPNVAAVPALLQCLSEHVAVTGAFFLFTAEETSARLAADIVARSLPVWCLGLEQDGVNTGLALQPRPHGPGLPVSCLKYVPPKATRRTSPSPHLLVLRPATMTRWQEIVLRYSALHAADLGYELTSLAAPPRSESNPAFFAAVMAVSPTRVICLPDDIFWPAMIEDHFDLLGVPMMTIHSDFHAPATEPWSLDGTIRTFLLSGRPRPVPIVGAGWDHVYAAVSALG